MEADNERDTVGNSYDSSFFIPQWNNQTIPQTENEGVNQIENSIVDQ